MTPTRNALWEVEKETVDARPAGHRRHGNEIVRAGRLRHLHDRHPAPGRLSRHLRALAAAARGRRQPRSCSRPSRPASRASPPGSRCRQDGQDDDELELPAPSFVDHRPAEGDEHDDRRAPTTDATARTRTPTRTPPRSPRDSGGADVTYDRRAGRRPAGRGARRHGARAAAPPRHDRPRPRRLRAAALARPRGRRRAGARPRPPASAHATLISTDPAEGAVLADGTRPDLLHLRRGGARRAGRRPGLRRPGCPGRGVAGRQRSRAHGRPAAEPRGRRARPWSSGGSSPRTGTRSAAR